MQISELQKLMRELYYHNDSKRGVSKTFAWVVEEMGELSRAMRDGDRSRIEDEFADLFAWLASLANLLGVDVEAAIMKKYGNGCPRCGRKPCECQSV